MKGKKDIAKILFPFGDGYYAVCRLYKGALENGRPTLKIVSIDEAGSFTREQWMQLSRRIKIWKDSVKKNEVSK